MSPELPPSLATYIDDRVNDLRVLIPKALYDFDSEAIHKARIATRRLTAAVRLLHPVLTDSHRKPFERALKKIRQRLGPLRDMDVVLKHLRELPEFAVHPSAVSWLSGRLINRRDEKRDKLGGKSSANKLLGRLGKWWALHAEVDEASKATDSLLAESVHLQLDAFAEQADALATQSLAETGQSADPHTLRIAGKKLRYTLELSVDQGSELPKAVIKTFKQMQDELGHWHDMVVLSEAIVDVTIDRQLPHHDANLAGQIFDMARHAMLRSERAIANFASQWASAGPELVITIRRSFRLTKPIEYTAVEAAPSEAAPTESKTDPDPSLTDESADPETPPPT
ncbi:hypothetical protein BH10PLA1_BH10PLA1_07140 [soil metagenome]